MKDFFVLLIACSILSVNAQSTDQATLVTIEEQRVNKAQEKLPFLQANFNLQSFKQAWSKVDEYQQAKLLLLNLGDTLWQFNKEQAQSGKLVDDRPLYWSRLAIKAFIKQSEIKFTPSELTVLLEVFEQASRGHNDLSYTKSTNKRILLTGFDPFFLDKNIEQSNPSGLTALLLDGVVIELDNIDGKKITAEINTAMVPVRYEDFDQGEVETLLAPFYALNSVDLIVTISMGRTDFDLEHFPGLRRSAEAPDNLNVYTGANENNPLIPHLLSSPLAGAKEEFVQFSLPYQAMMKAEGAYKINDNRGVSILESGKAKELSVNSLAELSDKISVQGGGGGYLSNEISYRSILLRNKLNSAIPTGHIHTPRISKFDPKTNQAIVNQIKTMLEKSLSTL